MTMENHHVQWVNQLFQWPCSTAFCMFTRPGKLWFRSWFTCANKSHQVRRISEWRHFAMDAMLSVPTCCKTQILVGNSPDLSLKIWCHVVLLLWLTNHNFHPIPLELLGQWMNSSVKNMRLYLTQLFWTNSGYWMNWPCQLFLFHVLMGFSQVVTSTPTISFLDKSTTFFG